MTDKLLIQEKFLRYTNLRSTFKNHIIMKNFFITAMCICLMTLAGCNKATADNDGINASAKAGLTERYPAATDVEWTSKNGYFVAKFNMPATRSASSGHDYAAWFSSTGKWCMTESEITYEMLPEAVKKAFSSSEYANWRIDDIDRLERAGMEIIYVIEVETRSGNVEKEADIYFSADGVIIKAVLDEDPDYDYEDYLPSDIESEIRNLVGTKYPGAVIMDIEYDDNAIEVEIVHERKGKDVYFSIDRTWIRTEWDVRKSELPTAVTDRINADYPSWRIDDAEYVDTPSGSWYVIELEKGDSEIKVRISSDGVVK